MPRPLPALALAALCLLDGAGAALRPRAARPSLCPPGRFLLPDAGGALIAGGPTAAGDTIVLSGSGRTRLLAIESGCEPKRTTARASRTGTRLRARWGECGAERKVRLGAVIEPDCLTMRGTVKASRTPPRPFVAVRSTCGDGRVDPGAGEECDAGDACPDGLSCEACRCGPDPATTTTTSPAPTSSTATSTTTRPPVTTTPPSTTTSTVTLPPTTTTATTSPPASTSATTTTSTLLTTTTPTSLPATTTTSTLPGTPPPDPATVAPAPIPGEITGFAKGVAFLRTSGIQTGADPAAFDARRTAVVRGRVLDAAGAPLPAVTITVLGHPELGQTLSRDDGRFDLSVNGGGTLTVRYEKADHLGAQRTVDVPWSDWAILPDVVLLTASPTVTAIEPGAAQTQEAAGDVVSDASGTRRAVLVVPPGTTAEMVLADGSIRQLATFHVRMTEFTVGPRGPAAMPAALPPSSGYTYAVEFSVDEAVAVGAREVRFNQPLVHYVENFLDFPVGGAVPAGAYDRTRGVWTGAPNGRVVRVVSVDGGLASLDVDGDGAPDDATALGVTDGERARVGARYAPGQTLWRVPLDHFTPWDCNWPYGPPPDSPPPNNPPPRGDSPPKGDDPCRRSGSVIECQTQVLGEDIPVAGTPLRLHYRSDRVLGRTGARSLTIPVTEVTVSPQLKRADVTVSVAGRRVEQSLPPLPEQVYEFTWDGNDAWGRPVPGVQRAHVRVAHVYEAIYLTPADFERAFARVAASTAQIAPDRTRNEVILFQDWYVPLGGLDARILGLGGWTLSVQHAFDVQGRLYLGDGGTRNGGALLAGVKTLSGPGIGTPQQQAQLQGLTGIASGPDGSIYVGASCRIQRIAPDGVVTRIAGHPSGCGVATGFEDGIQASQASLSVTRGMAIGPDGRTIYFAEQGRHRIRRIGADGIIQTIAGSGTAGFAGDGGPATTAQLRAPWGLALAADGSLYVADSQNHRIRRIGPEGFISTFAGSGAANAEGDGGPAGQAGLYLPQSVAVGRDGIVYVVHQGRVRRIDTQGLIRSIPAVGALTPGTGLAPSAQAAAIGADGQLYVAEPQQVRRVLADGSVDTVFGSGAWEFCPSPSGCGEGGPATAASAFLIRELTVLPDGRVTFLDETNERTRTIEPPLPRFSEDGLLIPSADGAEVYRFEADGRHLDTIDALTGAVRWQLGYDPTGRLVTLTDGDGNVTSIERDAAGVPTAIVAPGGQVTALALDADGYLATVTAPPTRTWQLGYDPRGGGLLTSLTDPRGAVHRYGYDALGRLTSDEHPAGGITTLARTETPAGSTVALTTGAGLTSMFSVEELGDGVTRRAVTEPTGAVTESLVRSDGTQRVTYPDGTVADVVEGPDPRWGMLAPLLRSLTLKPPSGPPVTRTLARTVTLAQPSNPFTLLTQTDTIIVGGATATMAWNAAARTFTLTTPSGRQETTTVDHVGRVTGRQVPGIAPVSYGRDARGRLTRAAHGPLELTYAWDAANRLVARTDALGDRVELGYDTADRRTSVRLPSDRTWGLGWDADGNLTHVTPPGTSPHVLAYDAGDRDVRYTPPGGLPWVFARDLDGRADAVTLPDGRGEDLAFDAGGRPTALAWDEAAVAVSYEGVTSRPDVVTRTPAGGGDPQRLDRDWTGRLPAAVHFDGPASGRFTYEYDARFRVVRTQLVSGPDTVAVPRAYDADGLATSIGPFAVTRDGPDGLPSAIGDGTGTMAFTYDALGRLSGRTHVVNGVTVYAIALGFDAAGRIVTRTETDATGTHVEDYTYDADGQLLAVSRDGTVAETYDYDDRGNRTGRRLGAGPTQAAVYDAQDRLQQRGATLYASGAAGFLAQRGADVFAYSAAGELLSATVGGVAVSHGYDGLRRRVTRSDAGGTSQYLYGDPDDDLALTAVREASGVLTWYHRDDGGRVIALERGGARYYVATDQLGSPRVVADATGAVVRRLRYDAFGVVVEDTAPAFPLALGFAGGLADPVTGLVRFGLRDYEPAAGRFTSRDPSLFEGQQGNLYAYAGNDPVDRVDPSGLVSGEVSVYEGIGADAKLSITPDGLSACFGFGFGEGGTSVGLDPFGDLDDSKVALDLKAKGQLGPVKLEFGDEISECRKQKLKAEGCLGAVCSKLDKGIKGDPNAQIKAKPEDIGKGLEGLLKGFKDTGYGVKVKVGAKICQQVKW